MNSNAFLQLAYGVNILILTPVCYAIFFGNGVATVFESKLQPSPGMLTLIGSLWAAILAGSLAGFVQPQFFAAILPLQIIYKALWLIVFILPIYQSSGSGAVPWGITSVFIAIVAAYPLLFWLGVRS